MSTKEVVTGVPAEPEIVGEFETEVGTVRHIRETMDLNGREIVFVRAVPVEGFSRVTIHDATN